MLRAIHFNDGIMDRLDVYCDQSIEFNNDGIVDRITMSPPINGLIAMGIDIINP